MKEVERVRVLIAIGSNIAPERHVPAAMRALERHPRIEVLEASRTYETPPVGGSVGQANFHNAAVLAGTELEPAALRAELRQIEAALGRVRTEDRYAARTVDLDIAFYGDRRLELDGTRIPDPDVARHLHLARPLADVAPNWVEPTTGSSLHDLALKLEAAQ